MSTIGDSSSKILALASGNGDSILPVMSKKLALLANLTPAANQDVALSRFLFSHRAQWYI
jgi:hypothetical protein